MLFRKKHPRSCSYCKYGTQLSEEQILCIKRGVRPMDSACRKFSYDPCKRIPPKQKPLDFVQYKDEDFQI